MPVLLGNKEVIEFMFWVRKIDLNNGVAKSMRWSYMMGPTSTYKFA